MALGTSVTAVNDAPAGTNNTLTASEDTPYVFSAADFGFTDPVDASSTSGANTLAAVDITSLASAGTLQYSANGTDWSSVTAGQEITATAIGLGRLRFVSVAHANGTGYASFTFQVRDNGGTANSGIDLDASANTITFNVTAVNDAPVASSSASLPADVEDTDNPSALTVYTLFGSNFSDSTDSSGGSSANTLAGVAIVGYTAATDTKGNWQYSTDGNTWSTLGTISAASSALTLKHTDYLRFVPIANWNGAAPALTVKLIDSSTTVTTGATLDVSTSGGTTAYSADPVVLSHSVTAVNDAPLASGSATLASVDEDTTSPLGSTVSDLFGANFADTTDAVTSGSSANTLAGVAIVGYTADAAKGAWQYSTNDGDSWTAVSTVSDASALTLSTAAKLRFLPTADWNGSAPTLRARLLDSSAAVTSGATGVNVSVNGTTTAISADTVVLSTSVLVVNDAPLATNDSVTVLEDIATVLTLSDFGTYSDVEGTAIAGVQITTLETAGTLQYYNGTSWTDVTLNQVITATDINASKLRYTGATNANGASYTTIGFKVSDGTYSASAYTLTVSVTAVNDVPSGADKTITIDEDTACTLSATDFGFSDANDTGHSLSRIKITTLPLTGTLTLDGTAVTAGNFVNVADINKLVFTPATNANGTGYASFTFQVEDDGGTSNGGVNLDQSANTITFNVTAANDAPVAVADSGATTENATLTVATASGVLSNDTDIDASDAHTVSAVGGDALKVGASVAGSNGGTFNIASDGSYVFTPGTAFDNLMAGATRTTAVNYTNSDGHGGTASSTLTITVTGENDAAAGVNDTASATEAGGVGNGTAGNVGSGNVLTNDTDVDSGSETKVVSALRTGTEAGSGTDGTVGTGLAGSYGTLTLAADGTYTYVIAESNATVQALRSSADTLSDTFTYTVRDASGATDTAQLVVTIYGANDNPVAITDTGAAIEAGGVSNASGGQDATGNVLTNDTDVDTVANGETRKVSGIRSGILGTGGDLSSVAAGSTSSSNGSSIVGLYGTLTIGADGSYKFVVDNSNATIDALATDATISETFTYQVSDAAGATNSAEITIAVAGTNDVASISGTSTASLTEGNTAAAISTSGTLTVSDIDSSATFVAQTAVAGNHAYGKFSINAQGAWTYTADTAHNEFAAGSSYTDSITVDSTDGTAHQTITVTIAGTNDAAVLFSATASLTEANQASDISTGGTLTISDVDSGATFVAQAGTAGTYGTFVIGTTGVWTYTASSAHDEFVAGTTYTDTFTVASADGTTSTVTVTITGTNDKPVASGTYTHSVVDTAATDSYAAITGTLVASDVDTAEALTWSGSASGTYGSLTVNADGSYSYAVDATKINALQSGTTSDRFTVTVTDSKGATATRDVVINVTGANDTPIVTNAAEALAGSIIEAGHTDAGVVDDGTATATGTLSVSDTDTGATKTWSLQGTPSSTYGTMAIVSDTGIWTYTLDNTKAATQALREGDTVTQSYTVRASDGTGGTVDQTVVITITGTNDKPVGIDDTASATEAGGVGNGTAGSVGSGNVLTNDTDVDSGSETKVVSALRTGTEAGSGTDGTVGTGLAGSYGTLTLAADGTYTYVIAESNATVQALLSSADTLTDTFTYTVRDAAGATDTAQLVVTIHGANDAPVAVADNATATEKGGVANATAGSAASGNVLSNDTDVDSGDTKTVNAIRADILGAGGTLSAVAAGSNSSNGKAIAGLYGTLTIGADGTYSYAVDNGNATIDSLAAGATIYEVFTYQVSDAAGATDLAEVKITITGANESPVAVADSTTTAENVTLTVNTAAGVLSNDTDLDAGDTHTVSAVSGVTGNVGSAIAGSNGGTFNIASDGSYVFTPGTDFDSLAAGTSQTTSVSYTNLDNHGGTSSSTLTVTVTGTNDAPLITGTANGSVTEDSSVVPGRISTGDSLSISDADNGQSSFTAQASYAGAYGTFTLAANGAWTYSADNGQTAIQQLGDGQSLTDSFTAVAKDGTASQTVTVTIHGSNDAPVASGSYSHAITDTAVSDTYTSLTAYATPTGTLVASDVDLGETLTWSGSASGTYGTLTVDANGSYNYAVNATAINALQGGTNPVENFTATVTDSKGATATRTITVNVTGANDTPVATGSYTHSVTDTAASDTYPNLTGTLSATDRDTGDALTWSGSAAGNYGTLTVNSNGSYSYVVDAEAVNALQAGSNPTESFTVTVTDSQGATDSRTIRINLTGADDTPVATGNYTHSVSDTAALDSFANLTGTLVATDADARDTLSWSGGASGTFGVLTVSSNGNYSYALNAAAVNALQAGTNPSENFTVTVTDSQGVTATRTITINLTGADDTPVATGTYSHSVADTPALDSFADLTGTLTATDRDTADTLTWSGSASGTYGVLTVNSNGSYRYVVNADAVNALPSGSNPTESFTATVTDSKGVSDTRTISINLTGASDAPLPTGTYTHSVTDTAALDSFANLTGTLTATSGDVGDTLTWSGSANGSYGALTVNANGNYSYVLNAAAVNALQAGSNPSENFTATVTSSRGASATRTITINVTGADDTPLATGSYTHSVTDTPALDSFANLTGTLAATDRDTSDTLTWSGSASGAYGVLTVNANGSYSYVVNADAVNALPSGSNPTDNFKATVTDSKGATDTRNISINVTGASDAPLATSTYTHSVTDTSALDSFADLTGTLVATGRDTADILTWSGSASGTYGVLTVNANGNYTYALNAAAVNALQAGTNPSENFTVTVTGSMGAKTTSTITINVAGADDTPVATGSYTHAVSDTSALDSFADLTGTLVAADRDTSDTLTWSGSVSGAYGVLTVNADGNYSYAINAEAFNALQAGSNPTDNFTVTVTDSQGATDTRSVAINLTGADDTPVATGSYTHTVNDTAALDSFANLTGTLAASDRDASDTLTWSGSASGSYGALTVSADGSYSYAVNAAAFNALQAGSSPTDTFTVTVTDSKGATDTRSISINLVGTDDTPVATGSYTHNVNDTTALDGSTTVTGTLAATDRDTGDTLTWSGSANGAYGALTVDASGSYNYVVNADALNAVPAGATASDSLTVTVTDSKGGTDTRRITINVGGANDAPVAVADAASATEAGGSANGNPGVDPSGNVLQNDTDPDLNDGKAVTAVSGSAAGTVGGVTNGSYGKLTLGADGNYSYQVDNSNAAVQALRQTGNTLTDTFNYTMRDASGTSSSASLTVTIHGANDTPQALDDAATVNAGETLTQSAAQGVLANDSDVDGSAYGESLAVAQIAQGSNTSAVGPASGTLVSKYGTLTLSANGSYSYVADGAESQKLWFGINATDTFTYTVKDSAGVSTSAALSLTISGVVLPPPPAPSIVHVEIPSAAPVVIPVAAPAVASGPAAPSTTLPSIITTSVLASSSSNTSGQSGTALDSVVLSNSTTQTNSADARSGTVVLRTDQQAIPGGANLTGDGGGARKLESTDRGFQVERTQAQATLTVSVENQQKGGDRLFVYKGIGSTTAESGQMIEYRVPKDAFAHTNAASIVQLEAALVDGAPLPQWLDFDPTSGAFSGRPPADAGRVIVIKVTARDEQGRETSATFTIRIEGQQTQPRVPGADPLAGANDLDSPEQTLLRVMSQRNQAFKRGSVPFSDQLKLSRQDPLVAKILSRQTANVHSNVLDRRLG